MSRLVYLVVRYVGGLLTRPLFRLRIVGAEQVPRTGPVILAANHASYLDPFFIGVACPRQLTSLGKQELFFFPLSVLLRLLGCVAIHRGGSDVGALRTIIGVLNNKQGALLLFPEGTRTQNGRLQRPLPGMALVAEKTGATIVPTVISGSYEAWPRGRKWPRIHKITVEFCPPMAARDYLEDITDREGKQRLMERIMDQIAGRYQCPSISQIDHAIDDAPVTDVKGEDKHGR